MRTLIITLVFLSLSAVSFAEGISKPIRGRIIDKQSQTPLPGANIIVLGTDPVLGATSDAEGYFKIQAVPAGRISLQISYLGYNTVFINNVSHSSAKEMVLTIEMEETVFKTGEIVVTANKDKSKPLNEMATLSARTFSVEESQRYAGARNDVSRMASNYAGVSTANDAVNDIVIRGNTPNGLLWKLDGVEIPNPNHFGGMGTTGGPVSMLNNNNLSNSDFMTSAFPAEYGNALSGVFDLKLRNGNDEKHEFLAQIGFNGFEMGAEGPISRSNRSSYLINYRYSTLAVFSAMGIEFGTGTAVPYYQDITLKLNFPMKKAGNLSIFGLGGKNHIDFVNSTADSSEDASGFYSADSYDLYNRNSMGVAGVNYTLPLGEKAYARFTLASTYINNATDIDSIVPDSKDLIPYVRLNLANNNNILSGFLNQKFGSRHVLKTGFYLTHQKFDMHNQVYSNQTQSLFSTIQHDGYTLQDQIYAQWQFKPTEQLVINSGLHFMHLALNNRYSVEPRLGVKWLLSGNQSVNIGYGIHSKTLPAYIYLTRVDLGGGAYSEPNKNIGFLRSHHFVAGYDIRPSEKSRIRLEAYYQKIFESVVEPSSSYFSMLNSSSITYMLPDSLKDGGDGYNYGAELTIERFLNKGYYYLFTVSVFESKYTGSNGIERPTAFDGRYVVNALAGKEFRLDKKENGKQKWLSVDIRACQAGGQRYIPIDLEKSKLYGTTIYDFEKSYTVKFDDYFRLDLRAALRLEGKRVSQEWALDIQNLTNQKNALYYQYNKEKQEEEIMYQLGLFPMIQYKIMF